MSEDETFLRDLFQYRFGHGNGLEGHSFGNLFIVAMTEVAGSFESALYESSRVLAVHGKILPSTMANLSLSAQLREGEIVRGESAIPEGGGPIQRVFVDPEDAPAYPPAVEAIREAQLIVIGPGSLYTSILPNLLVSGITDAIRASDAVKVFICNVATQKGETDGYSVVDHVEALQTHTFPQIVDYVLASREARALGSPFLGDPVTHSGQQLQHVDLVLADLVDPDHAVRHDSGRLANAVLDVYHGNRKATPPAAEPVESVPG